ncbi:MAG: hypothetical protein HGA97_11125 [Chlorobiaceae bacterium]|nr:hypothetical protein [Chlorobiaceae bacterium]
MHNRKHTAGRNILRIFEIALFFAVSVLGYGLLLKVSSSQTKSKSREHAPDLRRALDQNGLQRELKIISGKLLFPDEPAISKAEEGHGQSIGTLRSQHCSVLRYTSLMTSCGNELSSYRNDVDRTPRPCNLLQRNPVLLV